MNKAFNIKKYTDILFIIAVIILALTLIPMTVLGFSPILLGMIFITEYRQMKLWMPAKDS